MAMAVLFWVALVSYLAVLVLSLRAGLVAWHGQRPRTEVIVWLFAAAFMAFMALSRTFDLEELVRQTARSLLYSENAYATRWSFQAPLAAAISVAGGLMIFACGWFLTKYPVRGRNKVRLYVAATMVALVMFNALFGLRIVSLHLTDKLLYSGPMRLNWIMDGGLTVLIGASAFAYARELGRQVRLRAKR